MENELKSNVARMVEAGVPEEKIAGYIQDATKSSAPGSYTTTSDPLQTMGKAARIREAIFQKKFADIDTRTGAPASERAAASVKITPAGKLNYLASKYGKENVGSDEEQNLYYRPKNMARWRLFNEHGPSLGDIAGLSGAAVEVAPTAATLGLGPLAANPLVQGGAAALGNVARQGLSGLIPGDEGLTLKDRALQVGTAGVFGSGTQLGANLAVKAYDWAIKPSNWLRRYVAPRKALPATTAASELTERTGVEFSIAQATGSRGALTLEGYLRQHPATKDIVFESELGRLKQLKTHYESTLDFVSKNAVGKEQAGGRAVAAYDDYVGSLVKMRSKTGGALFDKVDELSGSAEIFELNNTFKAIDDIAESMSTRFGTDTSNELIKRIQGIKSKLIEPEKTTVGKIVDSSGKPIQVTTAPAKQAMLTPSEFQNSLRIYGGAARGKGNVIKDLDDKRFQREIAQKIYGGLLKDLDGAAGGAAAPEVAAALKDARDMWAAMSKEIDNVADFSIAKMIDAPGEKLVDKFLSKAWAPSQMRENMMLLDSIDPVAANDLRRSVLEEVFEKARPRRAPIGGEALSPARLAGTIDSYDKQIKALLYKDPEALAMWKDLKAASGRVADVAGTGGSQTAPLQWTDHLVQVIGNDLLRFNIPGLAADVGRIMAPRKIAGYMLDSEGRTALRALIETKAPTKAVLAAVTRLRLIGEKDSFLNEFTEKETVPNQQ